MVLVRPDILYLRLSNITALFVIIWRWIYPSLKFAC